VTYDNWDETNVRWSPDGGILAFVSNKTGSTVIHWQELQGGGGGELEQEKRNYLHAHGTLAINAEGASVSSNVRIAITDEAGRSFAPKDAWIQADDGYNRTSARWKDIISTRERGGREG